MRYDNFADSLSNSAYSLEDILKLFEYQRRVTLATILLSTLGLAVFGMVIYLGLNYVDDNLEPREEKNNIED